MNADDKAPPATAHPEKWAYQGLAKKLAIWALFLGLVYLVRDFFFIAFMTFLFCYLTLAVVGWCMKRLAPGQERPGLRRLLTVAVFVVVPLLLALVGFLVGPGIATQSQDFAGWLSHVDPETEVSRQLEKIVGPAEFKSHYGGIDDPAYQKGLEEFRKSGVQYVTEYNQFPALEAFVEGGFDKQFADQESGRIRVRLMGEGTSSKDFEQWFVQQKLPELQEQARKHVPEKGRAPATVDALVKAAASAKPDQLLEQVRHDPDTLSRLRQEWIDDTLQHDLAAAMQSPAFQEQFRQYYEKRQTDSPQFSTYTVDQYLELKKARPQGPLAFGKALEKIKPAPESEAQLRADFEAAKQHELFKEWWSGSPLAKLVRQHVETSSQGAGNLQFDRIIATLMRIPLDLSTALLLSFFICIDFPALRRAAGLLRETWLRDAYDEMAPALSSLGQLTGRALHAQGLIALCNAFMMFLALTFLGVEHAILLSLAVFVLCLVPTLGTLIAWVLIATVALIQPGGGVMLALKVSVAVVLVVLLETFVFSPRILGRMMELHPVLLMAILPVAQYFFGIWGLILATPVAVYVIHVLILGKGLPGIDARHEEARVGPETPTERV